MSFIRLLSVVSLSILFSCSEKKPSDSEEKSSSDQEQMSTSDKQSIIIDTDANNELDDQHALAYALFNGDVFNIKGVTVNHTTVGTVQDDYDEAQRVMKLCKGWEKIPLKKGVDSGRYPRVKDQLKEPQHEGYEAIDFIIEQAHGHRGEKLILAPVGKLTNIALALDKDPSIIDKVMVIWLGGNYYGKDGHDGEHNLVHDPDAYNAVVSTGVEFTMVTVRYGDPSGTDAVAVHVNDIQQLMPGLGPEIEPITGRHGGSFSTFGDYSVNLFVNYTDGTRPLFDMVVFAILKNPDWGEFSTITAPKLDGENWSGTYGDKTITLVENFNKEAILEDFFKSMQNPSFVDAP